MQLVSFTGSMLLFVPNVDHHLILDVRTSQSILKIGAHHYTRLDRLDSAEPGVYITSSLGLGLTIGPYQTEITLYIKIYV